MTTAIPPARHTHELRRAMADNLIERGLLTSPQWQDAFRTVPRELFVSRYTVPSPDGDHRHYDLTDPDQADEALTAVYQDTSLLTQQDAHGTATSSSTAPSLMAMMLEALDATPGMTALEIGSGTGYNAALLCHVLGGASVTTVDVDPNLVTRARAALQEAGHRPTVVYGDGARGHRERAPYDRLIATCGITRIPEPWLQQLRPGGVIVANLGFGLAHLTVDDHGSADGAFVDYASFMTMRRSPDEVAATARDVLTLATGGGQQQRTAPFPAVLDEREVAFLRSVMMPAVTQIQVEDTDGTEYVLADHATGSWARARAQTAGSAVVTESGPRRLWDELVSIAEDWVDLGRPAIAAYGLAVTARGEHELWLDGTSRRWAL